MSRLVLASKSTARADILSRAGVEFEVEGSGVDEDEIKTHMLAQGARPREIAAALAEAKAVVVSRRLPALIIGADQTLELDGDLFDKVETLDDARVRLQALRGREHQLHSSVALARHGHVIWRGTETATLAMRGFSDDYLAAYMTRNSQGALTSVGCYQLEGEGLQLFERIDGDYFSILGLPMLGLLGALRREGIIIA